MAETQHILFQLNSRRHIQQNDWCINSYVAAHHITLVDQDLQVSGEGGNHQDPEIR